MDKKNIIIGILIFTTSLFLGTTIYFANKTPTMQEPTNIEERMNMRERPQMEGELPEGEPSEEQNTTEKRTKKNKTTEESTTNEETKETSNIA